MIKLHRLRRRLLAAQIVKEFRGSDDKEARHLKRQLQRPILEDKRRKTQEAVAMVVDEHRRSSKQLVEQREALYQRWLIADRQENVDEAIRLQAKIEALDWVMGRRDVL